MGRNDRTRRVALTGRIALQKMSLLGRLPINHSASFKNRPRCHLSRSACPIPDFEKDVTAAAPESRCESAPNSRRSRPKDVTDFRSEELEKMSRKESCMMDPISAIHEPPRTQKVSLLCSLLINQPEHLTEHAEVSRNRARPARPPAGWQIKRCHSRNSELRRARPRILPLGRGAGGRRQWGSEAAWRCSGY